MHNLRAVDVRLPRGQLIVFTGPSGSGKSSLAFDVLFAEGQRRFIDCLSPYARQYVAQLGRPDIDELSGVPPTVSISQRTSRGGRKSTVATVTEIYHYLRLIFARIGVQHCPSCGARVSGLEQQDLLQQVLAHHEGYEVFVLAPAVRGRKGFHRDIFKRALASGQQAIRVDGQLLPLDQKHELARFQEHDIDYVVGRVRVSSTERDTLDGALAAALELGEGTVLVQRVGQAGGGRSRGRRAGRASTYSLARTCADCGVGLEAPDPRLFSFNSGAGACAVCHGSGVAGEQEDQVARRRPARARGQAKARRPKRGTGYAEDTPADSSQDPCPQCAGTRLAPAGLSVRLGGRNIAELCRSTPVSCRRSRPS